MGCCIQLTFSNLFLSATGWFSPTGLWLASLISCIKVRIILFTHFGDIIMNHIKPVKSTSTSLCIFLWPLVPFFSFCAFHFSSHPLSPPLLPLYIPICPQTTQSQCPKGTMGATKWWHTETDLENNLWIEWIPYREGQNSYASPDLSSAILLCSQHAHYLIRVTDWTQRADLHWFNHQCLVSSLIMLNLAVTDTAQIIYTFAQWYKLSQKRGKEKKEGNRDWQNQEKIQGS